MDLEDRLKETFDYFASAVEAEPDLDALAARRAGRQARDEPRSVLARGQRLVSSCVPKPFWPRQLSVYPRRRRLVVAAAVAALAAAVLGGRAMWPGVEYPPSLPMLAYAPVDTGEQPLLLAAAARDAAGSDGPVRYWRTETWALHGSDDGTSAMVPEVREHWLHGDVYAYRASPGRPVDVHDRQDRDLPEHADGPLVRVEEPRRAQQLARSLPADADAILEKFRDLATESETPQNVEIFELARSVLDSHAAPPRVEAAVYRALAEVDGVDVVGRVTDREGREGVAVAMVSGNSGAEIRYELIIEPETGKLLALQQVLLEDLAALNIEAPAVIEYRTFLAEGYTSAVGETPDEA